jgi:ribosomal protein S18 acetylase RimI-like enzyme
VPLPAPLLRFWYERDATDDARRTSWGMVFADPRFPLIYDANRAGVLEEVSDLTLKEVRKELLPMLERAGSPHEHIEFWAAQRSPAVEQIRAEGAEEKHDVVMVFEGDMFRPETDEVEVHEIVHLDEGFLQWYRASRDDFGEESEYTPDVVEQLFRRDIEVFVPRGMRFFAASIGGARAGLAALQSLTGVGYISTLVTMPEFRRRGVGSALVRRVIDERHRSGDELFHLLAEKDGAPQRLYERLGFRVVSAVVSFTHPTRSAREWRSS